MILLKVEKYLLLAVLDNDAFMTVRYWGMLYLRILSWYKWLHNNMQTVDSSNLKRIYIICIWTLGQMAEAALEKFVLQLKIPDITQGNVYC